MSELKVGDVVQLKSGGPNMTITNISSKNNKAICQYFVMNGKSWELGPPIQAGLNALMLSPRTCAILESQLIKPGLTKFELEILTEISLHPNSSAISLRSKLKMPLPLFVDSLNTLVSKGYVELSNHEYKLHADTSTRSLEIGGQATANTTQVEGASEDLSINKSLGNSTAAGITTPNPFEKKLSK